MRPRCNLANQYRDHELDSRNHHQLGFFNELLGTATVPPLLVSLRIVLRLSPNAQRLMRAWSKRQLRAKTLPLPSGSGSGSRLGQNVRNE